MHIGRCPQNGQQRPRRKKHHQRRAHAQPRAGPQSGPRRAIGLLPVAPTQVLRDHHAHPHADDAKQQEERALHMVGQRKRGRRLIRLLRRQPQADKTHAKTQQHFGQQGPRNVNQARSFFRSGARRAGATGDPGARHGVGC